MADGVEKKVCLPFQARQNTIKTEFKCLALVTHTVTQKQNKKTTTTNM